MVFDDLKKELSGAIMDLKPAPIPDEVIEFEEVTLDRSETDNSKWLSYITAALKNAKIFEIHCWNEETEWIELALQYGSLNVKALLTYILIYVTCKVQGIIANSIDGLSNPLKVCRDGLGIQALQNVTLRRIVGKRCGVVSVETAIATPCKHHKEQEQNPNTTAVVPTKEVTITLVDESRKNVTYGFVHFQFSFPRRTRKHLSALQFILYCF